MVDPNVFKNVGYDPNEWSGFAFGLGLERIAMYLQEVENVYDLCWVEGVKYRDIYHQNEVEQSKYNFEVADIDRLFQMFDIYEAEAENSLAAGLSLAAYDYTLKCSDIISNECKRLKDFIDDFGSILDIKLNREEFYILDFFKEMMDSLKILFNDVTFTCEIASDLKLITGDRGYLYKAFYNILKNACEANPAGEIKIIYTVDSTIKYKDSEKNRLSSMAKFIIIDQAGGIPREIQDKMFIPFFTTKSKGNGLGLVIAKEIIERHKGRLAFSTNNIGTVFTVFLPL